LIVRNTKSNLDLVVAFLEANSGNIQRQLGISVEYIQLDHIEANRRIRKHLASGKADATVLHKGLTELVTRKKAKRVASTYLVTRSGQRAKVESIIERIYPPEFDPPEVPQELS
jgi:hypothetical protein